MGVLRPSSLSPLAALTVLVLFAGAAVVSGGSSSGADAHVGRGLAGLPCESMNTCVADIMGVIENGAGVTLVATANGAAVRTAVADATGAFIFSTLARGTYVIGPTEAGTVSFEFLPSSVSVTLSGNGLAATAPRMVRRIRPAAPAGLQCATPANIGNRFTVISAPAGAPAPTDPVVASVNIDDKMTSQEFLASLSTSDDGDVPRTTPSTEATTPFFRRQSPLSALALDDRNSTSGSIDFSGNSTLSNDRNISNAGICAGNGFARYGKGTSTSTKSICKLFITYGLYGDGSLQFPPGKDVLGDCSGTFIPDPSGQGRLLFLTAVHCVAIDPAVYIDITKSRVECNQSPGATDGTFKIVASVFHSMDVAFWNNQKKAEVLTPLDGAVLQLQALANTNLNYAQPIAVAAITAAGLQQQGAQSYKGGFPVPTTAFEGCTEANLAPTNVIHFMETPTTPALPSPGVLTLDKVDGCQGNSGGPLIDEQACVVYGVVSASRTSCANQVSTDIYTRITADATTPGLNLPALISALQPGKTTLLPQTLIPNRDASDLFTGVSVGNLRTELWFSKFKGQTFELKQAANTQSPDVTRFVSIASSSSGQKIIAADMGGTDNTNTPSGALFISNNFGANWVNLVLQTGFRYWSSVAMSLDGNFIVASAIANNLNSAGSLHFSRDGGVTWTNLVTAAGSGIPSSYWSSVSVRSSSTSSKALSVVASEFSSPDGASGGNVYKWDVNEQTQQISYQVPITTSCLNKGTDRCPGSGANPPSTDFFVTVSTSGQGMVAAGTVDVGAGGDIFLSAGNGQPLVRQGLTGTAAARSSWTSVSMNFFGSVVAAADYANGYIWTAATADPLSTPLPIGSGNIGWTRRDAAGVRKWAAVSVNAGGNFIAAGVGWPLLPILTQPVDQTGFVYISGDFGVTWSERPSSGPRSYRALQWRI